MSDDPLHIQKLAVGISSVDALRRRVESRLKGRTGKHVVLTRMMPRRSDEVLAGGSIYWVISGAVRARQRIVAIESFGGTKVGKGKAGRRCRITLDPEIVETEPVARKPFQGWRYLIPADAPLDLRQPDPNSDVDLGLQRELAELGLL